MKKFLFFVSMVFCSLFSTTASARVSTETYIKWAGEYNNSISLNQLQGIVTTAIYFANKKHLDPTLVLSVLSVESNFKTHSKSKANAKGLMQIVPKYHKKEINGRNIFDINTNIDVGTDILSKCFTTSKRKGISVFACYSGYKGIEKIKYTNKVLQRYSQFTLLAESDYYQRRSIYRHIKQNVLCYNRPRINSVS